MPTARYIPAISSLLAIVGVLMLAFGCANDGKPPTTYHSDSARVDPFNYKPKFDDSINGGSLGHYDDKAMKKDLKSVFDP